MAIQNITVKGFTRGDGIIFQRREITNAKSPMSDPLQRHISSGLHLTRVRSRYDSITKEADSLDVLFVEGVHLDAATRSQLVLNWLSFPFGLLTMMIYLLLLEFVEYLTGYTDQHLIEKLESHYEADIIRVDENVHELIAEGRFAWGIGHWVVIFISTVGLPTWMEATASNFQLIVDLLGSTAPQLIGWVALVTLMVQMAIWLLLGGGAVFLLFAAGTLTTRNHTMVSNIEEHVECNSSRTGCLIIGRSHRPEIERLARQSEGIKLVG